MGRSTFAIAICALVASCELLGPDIQHGPISPVGIEELTFGLPAEEIEGILGMNISAGIADDFTTGHSWFAGIIDEGHYKGVGVGTLYSTPDTTFEDLKIDLLLVSSPYKGTTYHGLGVGSHRTEVDKHLGAVRDTLYDNRPDRDSYGLLYCFEERNFEAWYQADTLEAIRLGFYYEPRHPDFISCR